MKNRGLVAAVLVALAMAAATGGATAPEIPAARAKEAMGMNRNISPIIASFGVDVPGAADSLACTIAPLCPHVWLGERPRFRVRLENRSSHDVSIVRVLDGSFWGRYPKVRFSYEGPPGGVETTAFTPNCGNQNPLAAHDFVSLSPGRSVDLFGSSGFRDDLATFRVPGRYVARFDYSAHENDLRAWLGDYDPDAGLADFRARFRRVPPVDLHAECTFEVQQR